MVRVPPDKPWLRLSDLARCVWAKSPKLETTGLDLPLWCHLLDSAMVAGRLWDEWLPAAVKNLLRADLPGGPEYPRKLLVWLAGVHDIGKATPAFAMQVRPLADRMRALGLEMPFDHPDRRQAHHSVAGQVLLQDWLLDRYGWSRRESDQFGIVVGGHHGEPPASKRIILGVAKNRQLLGSGQNQEPWRRVQWEILDWAARTHAVEDDLARWKDVRLTQTAQALLTGVVIVADWIASNHELFPYDLTEFDPRQRLDQAWNDLDLPTPWRAIRCSQSAEDLFSERFVLPVGAAIRPVQREALAAAARGSGLVIIEAPMGEGKTEAAFAVAEVLAARSGAGGVFVALPTRATSDAMFARVRTWLEHVPDRDGSRGAYAVALAHGKAHLNEQFTALFRRGHGTSVDLDGNTVEQELAAHHWLTGRKKTMLASFVVGTIDQLLFGALKAKHLVLRHLGLAGKVVIIDEAHAFDVYMGEYLDRVLEWLGAYGVPVIVLSATLPAQRRAEMMRAYDGTTDTDRLAGDIGYPVITTSVANHEATVRTVEPSGRQTSVEVRPLEDDLSRVVRLLRSDLESGGCALVVRNTVRRVQETAVHLSRIFGRDRVTVAHSRFLAPDRIAKDTFLRDRFGPAEHLESLGQVRPDKHIVVASQVAEQSLDIDFDLLITDLAPIDLMLQRMGRLHRHVRSDRPAHLRTPRCYVTGVDWTVEPPEPVDGSKRVYRHFPLLRSLAVLSPYLVRQEPIRLPDDIAPLVQAAYGVDEIEPQAWRDVVKSAKDDFDREIRDKRTRAATYRIDRPRDPGRPLIGWLYADVGNLDDDSPKGRAHVRDTNAESVEVIVLIERSDGVLVLPPWLDQNGGAEIATDRPPPNRLARAVTTCTVALPYQLCGDEVIEELERRSRLPGWAESRWLDGELALILDHECTANVLGHNVRYDPWLGLEVRKGA